MPKIVGKEKSMENPIQMDDLGVPPFQETTIWSTIWIDVTNQATQLSPLGPPRKKKLLFFE